MSGTRSARHRRFPARRRTLGTVAAVVAVAAGAVSFEAVGSASAATLDTVHLTVDGVTTDVTTSASTVGALLVEQSIAVDSTDIVAPSGGSSVSSGMRVSVDHAALISVVDGDVTTDHLVTADTVSEATAELALPQPDFSKLTASTFDTVTFRRTVTFGPSGRQLSNTEAIHDGSRAVVQDVRIAYPTDQRDVARRVVRDATALLPAGAIRVVKPGRDGVRKVWIKRVFVEGTLTTATVVKSVWVKEPRRRVVKKGTGPNWYALGRCESGNNPNAVNPAGYYGLYQFSLSTWHGLGGKGSPTDWGYWEQTYRAWKLFQRSGRSPWPVCGAYL